MMRVLAPLIVLALTAAGCSGSEPAASPSSDPAARGSSEKLVEVSPLTGVRMKSEPRNPVFVVKIENTDHGEPQYGLDRADLVVEELVEGGLTRLAAFYYSRLPTKVGHVRSMRATDIGIAAPVAGQVVASGGAPRTYRQIKRAGIKIFSGDRGAPGFRIDHSKPRPYNLLVDLRRLNRAAHPKKIPGPYLARGAVPDRPDARTAKRATVRFSGSTSTHWRRSGDRWHRSPSHSARGHDFTADTVVVMFCRVTDAGYRDPAGNPVPETVVKGSGRAIILSGATVTEATWKKPTLRSKITFTGKGGRAVPIEPGHVWLEMVPKGAGKVSLD